MPRPKSVTPLINDYRRMVALHAHKIWWTLPKQIQVWISIEDMIEDGMFFAYRFAIKRFDPNRASFSTALYHAVYRYFIREYAETYGAQKRGWEIVEEKVLVNGRWKTQKRRVQIAVQSMNMIDRDGEEKSIEEIVGSIPSLHVAEDLILANALTECFTVPSLVKVYSDASPKLQDEMVNWFWHRKTKEHKKSQRFKRLSSEFRQLCTANSICCDDCIHLIRSPKCLDSLSRQLMGIPYNLDNPTPGIGNNIW